MSKFQAAIFDMDGVLAHTNPFHSKAFKEFFGRRGLKPTEEEFAEHMYGKNNRYILSHFLGRRIEGPELCELEDEKESLFRDIYEPHVAPVEGLLDFLKELEAKKIHMAVATSAPRANLKLILEKLAIGGHMESKLASEDVEQHKPDPEIYLKSATNLGVGPADCAVFEDSFSGASAALSAGAKVIGVLTSHSKEELPPCDFYIKDFTEINFERVRGLFSQR